MGTMNMHAMLRFLGFPCEKFVPMTIHDPFHHSKVWFALYLLISTFGGSIYDLPQNLHTPVTDLTVVILLPQRCCLILETNVEVSEDDLSRMVPPHW